MGWWRYEGGWGRSKVPWLIHIGVPSAGTGDLEYRAKREAQGFILGDQKYVSLPILETGIQEPGFGEQWQLLFV